MITHKKTNTPKCGSNMIQDFRLASSCFAGCCGTVNWILLWQTLIEADPPRTTQIVRICVALILTKARAKQAENTRSKGRQATQSLLLPVWRHSSGANLLRPKRCLTAVWMVFPSCQLSQFTCPTWTPNSSCDPRSNSVFPLKEMGQLLRPRMGRKLNYSANMEVTM